MDLRELEDFELVVISRRTGQDKVFAVNPATGDARNLSRHPGSSERYPSWSPDGSLVAFTSDRDGTYNLYVADSDGGHLRQLTHEPAPMIAGMQTWTADGAWIYFGLFGNPDPLMCRIAPDGSGFSVIGTGVDPAVSPDGRTIVFARNLGHGHCLFRMETDGTGLRQLTRDENPWAGVHASWLPDSSGILYAHKVEDALELFRCDPYGGGVARLTHSEPGRASTSPAASPDMRWIAFRRSDEVFWRDAAASERAYRERRTDMRPVWVMGIDGTDPTVIEPLRFQIAIDGSRPGWRRASRVC
jgi:TolB protein